jgi:hypothetical protein
MYVCMYVCMYIRMYAWMHVKSSGLSHKNDILIWNILYKPMHKI